MSAETGQNMSTAVMQRRVEAHDSLDDFPTPPWATRALIEHVIQYAYHHQPGTPLVVRMTAQEPCANRGYMARPLREYFGKVIAADVHDYGVGYPVSDYLMNGIEDAEWTISNPPFRLAEQFIRHSFRNPKWRGTAMLVRSAFLEGGARYRDLFKNDPPAIVAQFVERVIMTKGIVRDPSKVYWDEASQKWRRPSTATAYCWLVWHDLAREDETKFVWIPPCRRKLERAGDYASLQSEAAE